MKPEFTPEELRIIQAAFIDELACHHLPGFKPDDLVNDLPGKFDDMLPNLRTRQLIVKKCNQLLKEGAA